MLRLNIKQKYIYIQIYQISLIHKCIYYILVYPLKRRIKNNCIEADGKICCILIQFFMFESPSLYRFYGCDVPITRLLVSYDIHYIHNSNHTSDVILHYCYMKHFFFFLDSEVIKGKTFCSWEKFNVVIKN